MRALDTDQDEYPGTNPPPAFYAVGTGGEPYTTGDISYADDLVSTAATLPGLQRKADILSAFTVLFDMELSPAKLRLAVLGTLSAPDPDQPSGLTIHGPD